MKKKVIDCIDFSSSIRVQLLGIQVGIFTDSWTCSLNSVDTYEKWQHLKGCCLFPKHFFDQFRLFAFYGIAFKSFSVDAVIYLKKHRCYF